MGVAFGWHGLALLIAGVLGGLWLLRSAVTVVSGGHEDTSVMIVWGKPGDGKSMFAAHSVAEGLKRGRRQFSSFHITGAQPLITLAHGWCEEFAGSDLHYDESGSKYNAREFKNLDLLEFGALSHVRHQDVTVRLYVQEAAMLDANVRRLAGSFVRVRRRGPRGERGRGGRRLPVWQHPWWFSASYYWPEQFDEGFVLKPGARPYRKRRFLFRYREAVSYNSFNRVVPDALQGEWDALRAGAAMCAALPPWRFRPDGEPARVRLPAVPVWPVTGEAVRAARRERPDGEVAARIRERMLAEMGYYGPEAAPADAEPAFWYVRGWPVEGGYRLVGEVVSVEPVLGWDGHDVVVVEAESGVPVRLRVPAETGASAALVGRRLAADVTIGVEGERLVAELANVEIGG